MFKFGKKKSDSSNTSSHPTQPSQSSPDKPVSEANENEQQVGLLGALKRGLQKTRMQLTEGLANLLLGEKIIDEALLESIETQLLAADIGIAATQQVIADMSARVKRRELENPQALNLALQQTLTAILQPCEQPLTITSTANHHAAPFVILMVGVNGAGKTTTIGKLAKRLQQEGKSVLLAAGDTFRAAAIDQLKVWGERNQIPVIAQSSGSDSASVIYDAVSAAKARQIEVVIADTAGRLHTQTHLMDELKKIKRVLQKLDPTAPHEIMLVLDAGIGQNALRQAQQFHEAIGLTGLTITKLDGTAKGGMVFSLAENLHLPIRYVGVGESIQDLQPFESKRFVAALLAPV